MTQPDDDAARVLRRRRRELSHYITKAEALALVTNLLERHQRLHHAPAAVGFWRRFWAKWRSGA